MDLGRPLSEAMTVYRERFVPAIKTGALLDLLPTTILSAFLLIAVYFLASEPEPVLGGILILIILLLGAAIAVLWVWYQLALIGLALDRPPIREGLVHLGKGVLVLIIECIVYFAIALIFLIPILVLWSMGMDSMLSWPAVILGCVLLGLVGFIALAIVGIYWALTFVVLVTERLGPLATLKRSWQIVAGRFWWMALYLLVFLALAFAIAVTISLLTLPLDVAFSLVENPAVALAGTYMSGVIQAAAWIVAAPYLAFYLVKVYGEFVRR